MMKIDLRLVVLNNLALGWLMLLLFSDWLVELVLELNLLLKVILKLLLLIGTLLMII
jgi:hypothetical protein